MNRGILRFCIALSISYWISSSAHGAVLPACNQPATLADNFDLTIPCVVENGTAYQAQLSFKPGADDSMEWDTSAEGFTPANCTPRKSICATVESGVMKLAAVDAFGSIFTSSLTETTTDGVRHWALEGYTEKWNFSGLNADSPATPDRFTMLFASDAQSGLCGDFGHMEVVERMNKIATANGNTVGLIVNGDIAQTGMAQESLPFWKDTIVPALNFPVFEGLGNHDYFNYANVESCAVGDYASWGTEACAVMMLDYIDSVAANISQMKWIDPKSRSYAFLLNGYIFVQLNHYPSFEQDLSGEDYDTEASILWAQKLLAANAATVKASVVLNLHDYIAHSDDIEAIVSSTGGNYVVGVFAGHIHGTRGYIERIGEVSDVGNYDVRNVGAVSSPKPQGGGIPVWYSGSLTQIANFFTDCDMATNTPINTMARSFIEVEFTPTGYIVSMWEGPFLKSQNTVAWK